MRGLSPDHILLVDRMGHSRLIQTDADRPNWRVAIARPMEIRFRMPTDEEMMRPSFDTVEFMPTGEFVRSGVRFVRVFRLSTHLAERVPIRY